MTVMYLLYDILLCYTYIFSRHLPRHSDIIHMNIFGWRVLLITIVQTGYYTKHLLIHLHLALMIVVLYVSATELETSKPCCFAVPRVNAESRRSYWPTGRIQSSQSNLSRKYERLWMLAIGTWESNETQTSIIFSRIRSLHLHSAPLRRYHVIKQDSAPHQPNSASILSGYFYVVSWRPSITRFASRPDTYMTWEPAGGEHWVSSCTILLLCQLYRFLQRRNCIQMSSTGPCASPPQPYLTWATTSCHWYPYFLWAMNLLHIISKTSLQSLTFEVVMHQDTTPIRDDFRLHVDVISVHSQALTLHDFLLSI